MSFYLICYRIQHCYTCWRKTYNNRINTNFHSNKIPEENGFCACLSILLLDSVVIVDKKYCPQILLEECKKVVTKKTIINSINEELNLDESDDKSDDDEN